MDAILCGTCREELTQVETGSWIDKNGRVWCPFGPGEPVALQTLHAPMITLEWAAEIRRLFGSSPSFWTPKELGRLMALSETQIREVLEAK